MRKVIDVFLYVEFLSDTNTPKTILDNPRKYQGHLFRR